MGPWTHKLSGPGAVYLFAGLALAYTATSISWMPGDSQFAAGVQLASLAVAFTLGALIQNPRPVWIVFCVMLTANLFLIGTTYAYDSGLSAYGFFGNPNYFGCALAIGLAAAMAYHLWLYIPFLGIGLYLCQSRTAFFASGVAIFCALWPRYKVGALVATALVFVIAIEASSGRSLDSLTGRLGIWQDTINHLTPFGSGFGSFYETYFSWGQWTAPAGIRASHAYNDFLELVFELGLGSIFIWIALALALEGSDVSSRCIVITFLAASLTFFPLWVPLVGQGFAFAFGHLARSREHKVLAYAHA